MGKQPQARFALINGCVVLPQKIETGQAVLVEGQRIVCVTEVDSLGIEVKKIDVGGRYITPGLIDIHIHGALGHTFNEPTAQAFAAITEENTRWGVTSLLATVATAPISDLMKCLEFTHRWMTGLHTGAQILGVHLEGPYLCVTQKGAQDPSNIRLPNDGTPSSLLEYHDVIRIMTLAPELPGALELIAWLSNLGIVPAAGHSCATEEDVRAAMAVGLCHVTHVWSAQSTTVREGPWRKPGLLEASLVLDGLTVEMIADNKHLPPTLMKLVYKCIDADRLCIISDAIAGTGLLEGSHFHIGKMKFEVHDGVGMMLDHSAFAGSITPLNQMIPILVDVVGIPLVEVIRMATLTPARVIGYDDRKGSLESGKDADLVIFEHDFTAWRTMIGGRWVHCKS